MLLISTTTVPCIGDCLTITHEHRKEFCGERLCAWVLHFIGFSVYTSTQVSTRSILSLVSAVVSDILELLNEKWKKITP
jgi:hypothetical protein